MLDVFVCSEWLFQELVGQEKASELVICLMGPFTTSFNEFSTMFKEDTIGGIQTSPLLEVLGGEIFEKSGCGVHVLSAVMQRVILALGLLWDIHFLLVTEFLDEICHQICFERCEAETVFTIRSIAQLLRT